MEVFVPAVRAGRARALLGWTAFALALLLTMVALGLTVTGGQSLLDGDVASGCVVAVGSAGLGAFILTRRPGHLMGWLFVAGGLGRAVGTAAEAWCVRALVTRPGSLPGGALASWLQLWTPFAVVALLPVTVVLFPDGRLPGRPWRVVPVLAALVLVLAAVVLPIGMWPYRGLRSLPSAPVPDTADARAVVGVMILVGALTVVAMLLALVALVARARRSDADVRRQLKWFGLGAACALILNVLAVLPGLSWLRIFGGGAVLTGIGLGIFRYRLYDIDRLINRTLVYGVVTVTLAGGFAALDITLAVVVGGRSMVVAAASAFVVALLLRPLRERVQDLVDRLFDRRTHNAVTILRSVGQRVGQEPVDPQAVLDALRRAFRDPGLLVFFQTRHPPSLVDCEGRTVQVMPVAPGQVTDPVVRDGERVAVLVHAPADPALVRAVVRAAAVGLEHARVQTELRVQLAEVQASRARIVAAGDAERRRIERDLHDGAQQRLVGLALHIQSAKRRSAHPPQITELFAFTVQQLNAGLEDIRRLVHGILPPALATGGLPSALADLARPGQVTVTCETIGRLDPGLEVTAWLVTCEAVTNATKHAPGHPIHVRVSTSEGQLIVKVDDEGPGGADPAGDGLRNLADRVQAHGGRLTIDSPPGAGTRLTAELPCAS